MNFPSFRLLLILILSFEIANNLPIFQHNSINLIVISLITLLIICVLWFILKKEDNYFIQIGFTLSLIAFFTGYFAFSINPAEKIIDSKQIIGCEGYITCSPLTKQSQKKNIIQKIELDCTKLFIENYSSIEYKGRVLITSMDPHLELEIGDKVLIKGTFTHQSEVIPSDEFDYGEYLKVQRIEYTAFVKDISDLILVEKYSFSLRTMFNPIRKNLFKEFRDNLPPSVAVIIMRMIFHGEIEVPDYIIEDFRKTGIIHVLVVSGQNIVLVFMLFFSLLSFFRFNRILNILISNLIVICYMLIVGLDPPVIRATVMCCIASIAWMINRRTSALNILYITITTIVLIEPYNLKDVSFLLSVFATWGILLYFKPLNTFFQNIPIKIPKIIYMPLAVSISAQIMLLPILIYYFKSISTISLFSNVILDLIISILMPLSLLCIFLNLTIPYLAYYYFKSLEFLAQHLISINQYFANIDFSYISIGSINLFTVLGYYLLIFALTIYYDYRVRKNLKE